MEKIIGIIEEKAIKEGIKKDKTPWKRASYVISGKKLATFDEEIITKFNSGMTVEVEYEVNTQGEKHYNNIKTMKEFLGEVPVQKNQGNGFKSPEDQLRIIRQACLKACAQMMIVIKDSEKVKKSIEAGNLMDLYLNTTDMLVEYVQNGIQIKKEQVDEKDSEGSSMPDF